MLTIRKIRVAIARVTKRESRARMLRRLASQKKASVFSTAFLQGSVDMGASGMDLRVVRQLQFKKHGRYW